MPELSSGNCGNALNRASPFSIVMWKDKYEVYFCGNALNRASPFSMIDSSKKGTKGFVVMPLIGLDRKSVV